MFFLHSDPGVVASAGKSRSQAFVTLLGRKKKEGDDLPTESVSG